MFQVIFLSCIYDILKYIIVMSQFIQLFTLQVKLKKKTYTLKLSIYYVPSTSIMVTIFSTYISLFMY